MNETCRVCLGRGELLIECCSGGLGCSCGGAPVPMGPCLDCRGTGHHSPGEPYGESLRMIEDVAEAGHGYLGSGPR